jgi:glycosyltransferase involved in cell wall biosynthesis
MIAILLISAGISLSYIVLICRYISGWNSIQDFQTVSNLQIPEVTVIIAFRNEERNIPELLKSLAGQTYPESSTEIIFADDHSEDHSVELLRDFISSHPNARLIELEEHDSGKKRAVVIAAIEAKANLLIFTDADCSPVNTWIETIVSAYLRNKPVLIASPVIIKPTDGFFNRFQSLELFSLIASTAGGFGINKPVMVNGANMAVEKNAYLDSIEFLENNTPSGDDVFLLLNLKKKFPGRLMFLKSPEASVYIKPHLSIFAFLQQRLRWVSKSKYYKDGSIIITAIIVLLINLWLLNCLVMSFFNSSFILWGGGVFLLKSFVDYIFLRKVLDYYNMIGLLKFFVISQFLYFLYVSFTGLAGNIIPSRWKGRIVQ